MDKLDDWEKRLSAVENGLADLRSEMATFKNGINEKLDTIVTFVSGAHTVLGLARKHWRRILMFGAGFVTAVGTGNPTVQKAAGYISHVLGG